MQAFRIQYLLGILILLILYGFVAQNGGYRLPFYYFADGQVFEAGDKSASTFPERILKIKGQKPHDAKAIFSDSSPVTIETKDGTITIKPVPNELLRIFLDFKFILFFSFLSLLSGFWFLESGKDFHLASFSFIITLFLYSFVVSLSYNTLHFIFQVSLFFLVAAMFNIGLRTTGKEIPGHLLLVELLLILFFLVIAYSGHTNAITIHNIRVLSKLLMYGILITVMLLQFENAFNKTDDPIERIKRWVLFSGTTVGFFIPLILYDLHPLWLRSNDPFMFLFWMALLFPFSLLYGTYRIQLVPFQLLLTRSIVAGLLTFVFASFYALVLLLHNLLLPDGDKGTVLVVHIIFLLTLIFFLDPARRRLT